MRSEVAAERSTTVDSDGGFLGDCGVGSAGFGERGAWKTWLELFHEMVQVTRTPLLKASMPSRLWPPEDEKHKKSNALKGVVGSKREWRDGTHIRGTLATISRRLQLVFVVD